MDIGKITSRIITVICLSATGWLTVQPVESVWCATDVAMINTALAVAVAGAILLLSRRGEVKLSCIDALASVWVVYALFRAWGDTTYPCAGFCLRAATLLMLYTALRLLFSAYKPRWETVAGGMLALAAYEAIIGADQMVNGGSRHNLYLLTGTFLNPGPYAVYLAVGTTAGCGLLRWGHLPKYGRWLAGGLTAVCAIMLPATWSRSALMAAAVCVGVIYWDRWRRWSVWVVAGVSLVTVMLYLLKQGSADGRGIIYWVSLNSLWHHPWTGGGIGSFFHEYAGAMARVGQSLPSLSLRSADVLDYAFCDGLRVAVEQGVIGLTLAVALMGRVIAVLWRQARCLCMVLAGLLVAGLFSYPLELLPYQVVAVVLVAYAASSGTADSHWRARLLYPAIGLSMVVVTGYLLKPHIERRVKAEADFRMLAGISDSAFTKDYYELLPLLRGNARYLFAFGKMLSGQGRYRDSNAILQMGMLVSNDPMFLVVEGNNYRDMGLYDEAEQAYRQAFDILPNRLYPLYRLMLLYEETGDRQKLLDMAHRVTDFKVKVESPATREMQERAQSIIRKEIKGT